MYETVSMSALSFLCHIQWYEILVNTSWKTSIMIFPFTFHPVSDLKLYDTCTWHCKTLLDLVCQCVRHTLASAVLTVWHCVTSAWPWWTLCDLYCCVAMYDIMWPCMALCHQCLTLYDLMWPLLLCDIVGLCMTMCHRCLTLNDLIWPFLLFDLFMTLSLCDLVWLNETLYDIGWPCLTLCDLYCHVT